MPTPSTYASFHAATLRMVFQLPEAGRLEVSVYTMSGRLQGKLDESRYATGRQSVVWNVPVPSGVYFVRGVLKAGERNVGVAEGRMVIRH